MRKYSEVKTNYEYVCRGRWGGKAENKIRESQKMFNFDSGFFFNILLRVKGLLDIEVNLVKVLII